MSPNIERSCLNCGNTFYTLQNYINRGHGKYCSRTCSSCHTNKLKPKIIHENNCSCFVCGKQFYRSESRMKVSRSGLSFCGRICKELAQKIHGGLNVKAIQPSHYGSARVPEYRAIAFSAHEHKCNRCSYSKVSEVLEVHHKNRNRSDNSLENLEILCPTCHEEEHYMTKSGKWSTRH